MTHASPPVAPSGPPSASRRQVAARARLVATALVAVLVLVVTAGVATAGDGLNPPSPDLTRPAMLSLTGRVAPPGGEVLEESEPYLTGPAAESPVIVPPPPLTTGTGALYAVGDSVLLGAEPYLRTTLSGWDVRFDAKVSRGVPEGFDLVRLNDDRIGDVLVVVLGHNYGGGGRFAPWLEAMLQQVDDVQRVVLVTVVEWSGAQPEVNRAIRSAPARHPNVVVADWAAVVAANPGFLRDHVHPNRSGAVALANLIAVMTGPAPRRDGSPTPRPRLLPIPAVSGSGRTTTTVASGGSSTSRPTPSTATSIGGSTTTSSSTTSTTDPSSTTVTSSSSSTTTATTEPSSTTVTSSVATSSTLDGAG